MSQARSKLRQPQSGRRVARHPPITTGGKGDTADFGTIRQDRALELLGKEATDEDRQPAMDFSGRIFTGKGDAGEHVDFARSEV